MQTTGAAPDSVEATLAEVSRLHTPRTRAAARLNDARLMMPARNLSHS
jgi:hypothetical protein